jgi:hypothetical protein
MVKPVASAPDLSGVFAIEFRGPERDETYSPSHQSAARGLEDEELEGEPSSRDDEQDATERSSEIGAQAASRQINFFA